MKGKIDKRKYIVIVAVIIFIIVMFILKMATDLSEIGKRQSFVKKLF